MSKLLRANLARLWKNKVFWLGNLFMFFYGIEQTVSKIRDGESLGEVIFGYAFIIGIVTSIFVSSFLGTEYGDGTLRNKLIVGCLRYKVYFANLLVNVIAVLSMCIFYVAAVLIVGVLLSGEMHMVAKDVIAAFMASALLVMAFCSIYTMLAMCCGSKTVTIAVSITGAFVFFLTEAYIGSMLTIHGYWTGVKRAIFEFIFDLFPSGQAYQYMGAPAVAYQNAVYNLLFIFITTFAGQFIFSRKDLK